MREPDGMNVVRLEAYQPPQLLVDEVALTVQLFSDHAAVHARLTIHAPQAPQQDLDWPAVGMELKALSINGEPLSASCWVHRDGALKVPLEQLPQQQHWTLETWARLEPAANTSLEGLYVSGGLFTTQCEAEGFRRITPFPDRPDVLSRYRVRIEADQQQAPVLLSNGNCVATGQLSAGRHWAEWDDPFPKPCYLFALVAGRLVEVRDQFTTASGRDVSLRIHVEPGDEGLCSHAMASLKRSMAWDESAFGLEYDLDEFNIVAVRHFNMGAMENKSLNIFNSKLVLADAETATDSELERIESVIGHEYFHNWTGNRVTCRDWFQLSLKEGLTVFRDQQFTADLHDPALKRIDDVAMLRAAQFPEDDGPTAHPVQPQQYVAINNFYTTTIYEKGAELIRMQRTILGEDAFLRGVQLYLRRHDGQAATCEQFVSALEEASGVSLQRFRLWYRQAGTPRLEVQQQWDQQRGVLRLTLRQHHNPSPGQPQKQPVPIPVRLGLIARDGVELKDEVLLLDQAEQSWTFEGLPSGGQAPVLSLLRGFSAPVRLEAERSSDELLLLLRHDQDPVSRWDAAQQLWQQTLLEPESGLEAQLSSCAAALIDQVLDPASDVLSAGLLGALLQAPSRQDLEARCLALGRVPDPPALEQALLQRRQRLGDVLAEPLQRLLGWSRNGLDALWPEGVDQRSLQALAWSWLVAAGDSPARCAAAAAVGGASMTLARDGLAALQPWDCPERRDALEAFSQRWQERPVILDSWFALEASTPFGDAIARAEALLAHPRFDPQAPNSLRAVLGGFARCARSFHHPDGSGYRWIASQLVQLDGSNPITASRMLKLFMAWRRYSPERQQRMRDSLEWMAERLPSPNSQEVVRQCLGSAD